MRAALAFSLAIACAVPAAARDAPDEAAWVPFDYTPANQIRFIVRLNGVELPALLDTGVSHSAISRRAARAGALKLRRGGIADTIGGSVPFSWTEAGPLTFGGIARSRVRLAVVDLPPAASGNAPVALLAGRDLIGDYALDIDYARRRFRLLPSGRLPYAGAILPLTIGGSRSTYLSHIAVGGQRLTRIAIDTGDGGGVTLTQAAWRQIAPGATFGARTLSYGVGGGTVGALATAPTIEIGGAVQRDVPIAIEGDGGFAGTIGVLGRLGTSFLRAYRVLLDPVAGRMVLAPAAGPGAAAGTP